MPVNVMVFFRFSEAYACLALYLWFLPFFAGFNSTLRQGNITHHEYIQVGVALACVLLIRLFLFIVSKAVMMNVGWKGKRCWVKSNCFI